MSRLANISMETSDSPDCAEMARVIRTAAAVHCGAETLVFHMTPVIARQIAQQLDGGGWRATQAAAALKTQADAEDRAVWVAQCQATLTEARRIRRRAGYLLAGAAAALFLIVGIAMWGLS